MLEACAIACICKDAGHTAAPSLSSRIVWHRAWLFDSLTTLAMLQTPCLSITPSTTLLAHLPSRPANQPMHQVPSLHQHTSRPTHMSSQPPTHPPQSLRTHTDRHSASYPGLPTQPIPLRHSESLLGSFVVDVVVCLVDAQDLPVIPEAVEVDMDEDPWEGPAGGYAHQPRVRGSRG